MEFIYMTIMSRDKSVLSEVLALTIKNCFPHRGVLSGDGSLQVSRDSFVSCNRLWQWLTADTLSVCSFVTEQVKSHYRSMVPALTGVSLTQPKLFQLPLLKLQHPPMSRASLCVLHLLDMCVFVLNGSTHACQQPDTDTHTNTPQTPTHTSSTPYILITLLTPRSPQNICTQSHIHAPSPHTHTAFPHTPTHHTHV